jgi:N4-gp56 family major capsid protein
MALTTATTVSDAIKEYWDTKALLVAQENLFQNRWARPGTLPQGIGKTYEWYRMENLDPVVNALTPGVTPQAVQPSDTKIQGTIWLN